ncbi:MAG: hypothetical protein JSV96_10080 [Candidatus Aminicenantes bacterium]|nr:MAG: hypothetical protein JSV96_10080 [Candidatus Aminicenantes bacterium]
MKKERGKNFKRESKEQGFILVIGVLIIIFLLLPVLPFLFQLSTDFRLTEKSYKSLAAFSLAEAGVERAIWELNYGDISDWSGDESLRTMTISSFNTSDGNVIGDIEIRVENPGGDNPVVEAAGNVAYVGSLTVTKAARVVLEKSEYHPFDYGIFGDEGVNMNSNAVVDSYDSRNGAYGDTNMGSHGNVGTNATHDGAIDLRSNAQIYGNAISGPETDPEAAITTGPNAYIDGMKLALDAPKELPSISPPEGLSPKGDYFLGGNDLDIINESGEYSSFMIDNNAKVTITADVTLYITGGFSLLSNSQLEIADGVSATIYLGGTFEQNSNTQINNLSMDPTKLAVYGTDTFNSQMIWNSNTQFFGAVYVPRADVLYDSNADFYGSIVGKYLQSISSNARLHYDEALGDVGMGTDSSTYVIRSWQEKL